MLERASRPCALLDGPRQVSSKSLRERQEQGLLSMKRKVSWEELFPQSWAAQASLCRVAGLHSTLVKPGPLLLLHSLEENFLFSLDSYGTPEYDAEPPGGGPGPALLTLPVLKSLSSLLDFIINFTHPRPVSSISIPKKSMNYNHCLLNSPYFTTSISALLTMPKLLTVWITINCGKFWKNGNIRPPDLPLENLYAGQNWTWNNRLVPNRKKEYVKAVYCHPAYLTSMQSTSWEMLGWKKHKLESRLLGEISITSDMQMTPPLWQKVKKN